MLIIPVPRSSKGMVALLALPCLLALASRRRSETVPAGALAEGTPLERAQRAVETQDPKAMRAEAKRLRADGYKQIGDALDQAAVITEKMIARRNQPAPVWPSTVDRVLNDWLLAPPATLTQDDLMVAAWLRSDDNGGPAYVVGDLYPDRVAKRSLTPRERWVLSPYFPVVQDFAAELNFGVPPGTPPGVVPGNLYAITIGTTEGPKIIFPKGPQSLLGRWWLAVLAHELVHVSQVRIAGGDPGAVDAQIKWGYELSPLEVQARYYQRLVYDDLVARARAFFLSRGPMPKFP